ncbi:MAG: xanthine dehydrogenase family protein subunit M [Deltaproteobacteria bacterium]|nr:xanthine dehydrogenase family protein subunit M [Deltaproteobacteria bacterium]
MTGDGRPGYERPANLEEALALLARLGEHAVPLAGGTDVALRLRHGLVGAEHTLVDLGCIDLDGLEERGDALVLGAAVRIADIRSSPLVGRRTPLLCEATAEFGSPQIRGRATLGGNLGNASPVADLAPALVALGARITLASQGGTRELAVEDFPSGPGKTVRRPDELITEVTVPFQRGPGAYERLVYRRQLAIAVASVAVHMEVREGRVSWARVAAGAVAPRVLPCPRTAEALLGMAANESAPVQVATAVQALATETFPISDARASRAYRVGALGEALRVALGRVRGEQGGVVSRES